MNYHKVKTSMEPPPRPRNRTLLASCKSSYVSFQSSPPPFSLDTTTILTSKSIDHFCLFLNIYKFNHINRAISIFFTLLVLLNVTFMRLSLSCGPVVCSSHSLLFSIPLHEYATVDSFHCLWALTFPLCFWIF